MVPLKRRFVFNGLNANINVKGKAVPLTGHEGPWDCEMLRLPHLLDSRLRDGGEATLIPQEYSWYSFLLETEPTPGP
jgi:hypothetical protein